MYSMYEYANKYSELVIKPWILNLSSRIRSSVKILKAEIPGSPSLSRVFFFFFAQSP